jgi:pimeloyl-ACP methyl ester carboxylesterase
MGGWIGFGAARLAPSRFRSMILGGAHPFAEDLAALRALLPTEQDKFAATMAPAYGSHLTDGIRRRLPENDLRATMALMGDREDSSDGLPKMTMPCLLICGDEDPRLAAVRDCAARMPDATLIEPPGCGHVAALARLDLTMPSILSFLDRVGP